MNITKLVIVTITVILLSGCGSEPEIAKDAESESSIETSEAKKKQSVILEPHLRTLNKAKGMEQKLKDAVSDRKIEMDEQEKIDETN